MKVLDAQKNLHDFHDLMLEDIKFAVALGKKDPSEFAIRTLIRTSAAYIEGTVYQIRLVCLAASEDSPNIFDEFELLALREKTVFLDNKGKIEYKDNFQSITASLLFLFNCFAKLHGIEHKLDTSDHRWGSFKEFVKMRNSLMHPKSKEDFAISERRNEIAVEAVKWFQESLAKLYRNCEAAERESKIT